MTKFPALVLGAALVVHQSLAQEYADIPKDVDFPASTIKLEAMRTSGNLDAQRNHLWRLFSGITRASGQSTSPVFLTWYGAGEVFAMPSAPSPTAARGLLQSFSLPGAKDDRQANSGAAPLIVRAHYNRAAYKHIRNSGLENVASLIDGNANSIPAFPRDAVVIKTVWWPVPDQGVVALPVWDPARNPPRATGNDYLTWSRVVGVSARAGFGAAGTAVDVEFLGRSYRRVHAVGIDALYHVTLDQRTAESLMSDPDSRKLAGMVLGRPLRAHDMVVLVALHLATRELTDWVWGTFWWHDRTVQSPYAPPLRPVMRQPFRNYSMSVSFDTDLPREPDGSPHVAFNPWLEARFPDSGHGGGVVSNCPTCHRRASTSADKPFLVTRGGEDPQGPAAWTGAVSTSSLWSLPLQAR